jgi:hypothetical protein
MVTMETMVVEEQVMIAMDVEITVNMVKALMVGEDVT